MRSVVALAVLALVLAAHVAAQDRAAPTARALLGQHRAEIDTTHTVTGTEGGWTLYGAALAITFDHDVATRVRVHTSATTCDDAARAAGFTAPEGIPMRRRDGCEWPGISDRHRLAAHVAARFANGVMEIWRTE